MRINEIYVLSTLSAPGSNLGTFQMPDEDIPIEIIGKIQGLTLILVERDANEMQAVLIDTKNQNQIAGKFDLSRFSEFANSWVTEYSRLSRDYTGRKLAPKVYVKLVQAGYTLVSDSVQSPGGMKIWRDLMRAPGVFVYAFLSTPDGKTKYSHVYGLEQHAGDANFVIYDQEYQQELRDLQELSDDYKQIENNNDYSGEDRAYAAKQRIKIEHAIKSLKKAVSEESRHARLIATAQQKNVRETAGVGRITAQNRTADVGADAIKKQAAKFGNTVDQGGKPPAIWENAQCK